jgi:hypothetical protein
MNRKFLVDKRRSAAVTSCLGLRESYVIYANDQAQRKNCRERINAIGQNKVFDNLRTHECAPRFPAIYNYRKKGAVICSRDL